MSAPSLCGGLVPSKQSLLALAWSLTTVLSFVAFVTTGALVQNVNSRYRRLERSAYAYGGDDVDYSGYDEHHRGEAEEEGEEQEKEQEEEEHESRDSEDDNEAEENDPYYFYTMLRSTSSASITFVALYTVSLAVAMSLYGSMAVVGFTSIRGQYIAPCFFSPSNKSEVSARIHSGIFMGCLVFFANLCLVCAIVLGEFHVQDYVDDKEKEEASDTYAIERVARILAVQCMFLAVIYIGYACLFFAFHDALLGGSDSGAEYVVEGGAADASGEVPAVAFYTEQTSEMELAGGTSGMGEPNTGSSYEPPRHMNNAIGSVGVVPGGPNDDSRFRSTTAY